MEKYKLKCYKGYVSGHATEWWTDEDWVKHRKYVQELKDNGTYGDEYEVELSITPDPKYDSPTTNSSPTESHRLDIIDFGTAGEPNIQKVNE